MTVDYTGHRTFGRWVGFLGFVFRRHLPVQSLPAEVAVSGLRYLSGLIRFLVSGIFG